VAERRRRAIVPTTDYLLGPAPKETPFSVVTFEEIPRRRITAHVELAPSASVVHRSTSTSFERHAGTAVMVRQFVSALALIVTIDRTAKK
jgi:hypothetical protein